MDVAIIHESLTGTTERAAFLIADELFRRAIASRVFPTTGVDSSYVAGADLVIVGTWVDGLIAFGQRPGKRKRIEAIPRLDGKPCAVFCTYAINPGKVLAKLDRVVSELGGNVLGGRAFRRNDLEVPVAHFTADVLAAFADTRTSF